MRRLQVDITLVESLPKGKWLVKMKSCSTGRSLWMQTTKNSYCRGQTVKLTCKSVSKEGELIRPRFSSWVPFHFPLKWSLEKREKALREHLTYLKEGASPGKKCQIEGGFEVEVDHRGWLLVYQNGARVASCPFARQAAKWIVRGV